MFDRKKSYLEYFKIATILFVIVDLTIGCMQTPTRSPVFVPTTTIKGETTTFPGETTTIPGQTTTRPGHKTTTIKGQKTTTRVGQKTTTRKGETTTTNKHETTTTHHHTTTTNIFETTTNAALTTANPFSSTTSYPGSNLSNKYITFLGPQCDLAPCDDGSLCQYVSIVFDAIYDPTVQYGREPIGEVECLTDISSVTYWYATDIRDPLEAYYNGRQAFVFNEKFQESCKDPCICAKSLDCYVPISEKKYFLYVVPYCEYDDCYYFAVDNKTFMHENTKKLMPNPDPKTETFGPLSDFLQVEGIGCNGCNRIKKTIRQIHPEKNKEL